MVENILRRDLTCERIQKRIFIIIYNSKRPSSGWKTQVIIDIKSTLKMEGLSNSWHEKYIHNNKQSVER